MRHGIDEISCTELRVDNRPLTEIVSVNSYEVAGCRFMRYHRGMPVHRVAV